MTKLRTPDSPEAALRQAIVFVGEEVIATALSNPTLGLKVEPSTVRQWADPDRPGHINLHQALAVDLLLRKAGHDPVFIELFKLQEPAQAEPATGPMDPLRAAVQHVAHATELLQVVDKAKVDGRFDKHELAEIERVTFKAQKAIALVRRIVRALLDVAPTKGKR